MYSEKVIEHFRNPHNFGEMKNPSGIGEVGNIQCGDLMKLYLKVEKKDGKDIISDVKFQTFGCAAAISTSSIITDMIKGKTLQKASEISNKDIVDALGGLPTLKIHCSVLAVDALNEAIYDYLKKSKQEIPDNVKQKHERILKLNEAMKERFRAD